MVAMERVGAYPFLTSNEGGDAMGTWGVGPARGIVWDIHSR